MTLDTQKTIALLQELLLALRDNDSNAFKAWLCSGHGSSVSPNSTLPATCSCCSGYGWIRFLALNVAWLETSP
jgi:hypothetical protein